MTKLAIDGGVPEVRGPIKPYNSIEDGSHVMLPNPLSGYLGGERHGGRYVEALEEKWATTFGVKHAVAVNSATSGLLIAAMAVGLKPGDRFLVSSLTMSATAAAPMFTGAKPIFGDINPDTFDIDDFPPVLDLKTAVVTNLFGHPAKLDLLTATANLMHKYVIEDNAQAPFATEYGHYAGTIGHIGVFSLNVHKHFQCGEGGVCVTNCDELADRMRLARNHGELAGGPVSLNLRMTEVTAAIALSQLSRAKELVASRVTIAEKLTAAVKGLPGLTPPVVREGCSHSYYCWALKVANNYWRSGIGNSDVNVMPSYRDWFVRVMQAEGVPLRAGYVDPLYRLPAFKTYARPCPVAERMHDSELVLFGPCDHDPTPEQLVQIGNAFQKVVEYQTRVA